MDCNKTGNLILQLRKEQGLTQKDIAEALNISNKTVSKWERGNGCPDVSLLSQLSIVLGVDIQKILEGNLVPNQFDSGNMKRIRFYVCPVCGNILFSTSQAVISCCGRKLRMLLPQCTLEKHQILIQSMDIDYFVSIDHEMSKTHYIMFIAYVVSDRVLLHRLYPEGMASLHLPVMQRGGKLYGYCSEHGLWIQDLNM